MVAFVVRFDMESRPRIINGRKGVVQLWSNTPAQQRQELSNIHIDEWTHVYVMTDIDPRMQVMNLYELAMYAMALGRRIL